MVTLSKPAAGDTNWATPINGNWTTIENSFDQSLCQGRLTLISGNAGSYDPLPKTPSATDTGADTVDFSSAHGWRTGTPVWVASTIGGLTAGTIYFARAVDSDTISFHATVSDAEGNVSKVNLTAAITVLIMPLGIASTTVYFTPYMGNRISLYSGSTWNVLSFSEISLALSGLTSGRNYDVFVYDNAGTPALELSQPWNADGVTRTDSVSLQDGIRIKTSDNTRRYVGTIRTTATNATEDSLTKRFVVNYYNRLRRTLFTCPGYNDDIAEYTYSAAGNFAPANAGAGSRIEVLSNGEDTTAIQIQAACYHPNSWGTYVLAGPGIDSTTNAVRASRTHGTWNSSVRAMITTAVCRYDPILVEGYHTIDLLIAGGGGAYTPYLIADMARYGSATDQPATFIEAFLMA